MENAQMKRDDILRYAAEQRGPDEREEQMDVTSGDDAYLVGMIICSLLAIIKIMFFHKKPYDIFTVQFASETTFMYKKWKRMRQDKYLFATAIYSVFFILSLGCFFKDEIDNGVKNE